MKKKFLINVIESSSFGITIINKIVECSDSQTAIEIAKLKIREEEPEKNFQYIVTKLNKVERLHEKELTIREVMKTTYSEENLRKTIKLYEQMLLKGLDFKTLTDLFSPYLIAYDHVNEECCVSKRINPQEEKGMNSHIIDIGFQWLPKKMKPFGLEMQNYHLWCEKIGNMNGKSYRLILKHYNDKSLQWNFVDFVMEMTKNIPDIPVRLETIVVKNL